MTHAMDFDIKQGSSRQKDRYGRLYAISDETDPRYAFYYTTKEEVKANISQLVSQLEILVSENPNLLNYDLETVLNRSDFYKEIMSHLIVKPGDDEIRVIQGNLAQRKSRARKQILSGVYSAWVKLGNKGNEEETEQT